MKRLLSVLTAALIVALSLSSCGQIAKAVHGGSGIINTEVKENITVTIFRCEDFYMVHSNDESGKGWRIMNFGIPAEVTLEEGGFGRLTADEKNTYGGDQGVSFVFENVTCFERITTKEAAETIGFDEYDQNEEMPYNQMQLLHTDGKEYLMIKIYGGIYVYLDGKPFGKYDTEFQMKSALGLRKPIEKEGVKMEEHRGVTLLVFRCLNDHLSYSNCAVLNEWWTPILDWDFKNRPAGFWLEDGEIAMVENADILIVNGGDEGYVNAPMLTKTAEPVKLSYYDACRKTDAAQWTDGNNSSAKDGEFWEYSADDYNTDHLIIFLDGHYLVYHDNGKEQYRKGVFDTPEEVNAVLDMSDE